MKNTEKKSKEKASAKFIGSAHVGIDVHKNSWKVCVLSSGGFRKEFSCNPEIDALISSLKNLLPNFYFECAYEAGFSGFWIADEINLVEGFNCIVVNAADIPTSDKERAQKEDRRDARKIAAQLKAEALKGIYIPSKNDVALRELQRLRASLTKDLTRTKARIKSFLFRHGIPVNENQFKTNWSGKHIKLLKELPIENIALRFTLNHLIENMVNLRKQQKEVLLELRTQIEASGKNKQLEAITQLEGIGIITGATILTEINDITRFSTYQKFHSFIGLVPSTNSSAEMEKIRGITNRSNKRLRQVLVEAAWIAIKKNTDFHLYYQELKQRMKPNKAIIRVAKKMATQIRYTLLNLDNQNTIPA